MGDVKNTAAILVKQTMRIHHPSSISYDDPSLQCSDKVTLLARLEHYTRVLPAAEDGWKQKRKSGGLAALSSGLHSQMVQQSKEKGLALRLQCSAKVIESVTGYQYIDAAVEQTEKPLSSILPESWPILRIDSCVSYDDKHVSMGIWSRIRGVIRTEERKRLQKEEAALPQTISEFLEDIERYANGDREVWGNQRRIMPEHSRINRDIVGWKVKLVDLNSSLIFSIEVEALGYNVQVLKKVTFRETKNDFEAYAREMNEHKSTMLLLNKADLLPYVVRKKWAEYFKANGILFIFWSAKAASAILEGKKLSNKWDDEQSADESSRSNPDTRIYGRG
ncbi:hypothetical protein HPP92_017737 [Vanilla planifolia]|uniref:Uncharacterized protein n=1 Tax=Vanilla planifolia TaxID=51239 RepID=A0A835QBG4_VANPL|nr:hypothetical protein HPP92_017737 [Vanilla planifolia]